jgi:hypothetical protein
MEDLLACRPKEHSMEPAGPMRTDDDQQGLA